MIRNASDKVIRINAQNPHYFEYKGREILLITSAEHYGAVISKKFDYVKYFDMLASYGLNYTRIYPGAVVECAGKWLPQDNMAPGPDLIVPWARSDVPGYFGGGNKFDLNSWDPEYFARLKDFLTEADKRGIIVEICFFNCEYEDFWAYSPLNKDANIQGVGDCDYLTFQTLDNEPLVKEQLRYIQKLITETNDFDNIIYEFVDEPTLFQTPSHKAYHWISRMIDTAVETERDLPKKHMLAQQYETGVDFCDDDRVALIVTQYILMGARQIGGTPALNNSYCFNKPIELNETAYIASWLKDGEDDLVALSRLEAWEFMVGGGAGFNQLNGYYVIANPAGEDCTNREILQGLKNLRTFLEGFDYAKMTRDFGTVRKVSVGASINGITEKGKQYAMYMHHSFPSVGKCRGSYYEPNYGQYEPVLTLKLEAGEYAVTFVDPATLAMIGENSLTSDGGTTEIACPCYNLDLAIKIIRI